MFFINYCVPAYLYQKYKQEVNLPPPTNLTPPNTLYDHSVVAPTAAPLTGSKKLLAAIFPSAPLFPCTKLTSTLLKLLSDHVALADHEFPLTFCALLRLTWSAFFVLPLFFAATLLFKLATAVCTLKPTSGLLYAVLRSMTKLPGCELSVKPFAALLKAMQFVMLWFAGYMVGNGA